MLKTIKMIIFVVAGMVLLTGFVTITTASTNILVESDHSYANNFDYTWPEINQPGATQMRLHFTKLELAYDYDKLTLLDKDGNKLVTFNKNYNNKDFWTEWYTENTIKVKLETNGYDTAYGFKIDQVETRNDMAPSGDLPESYHSYANSFDYTWPEISRPEATQMRLHFTKLGLAYDYDKLTLLDKDGNKLVTFNKNYNNKDFWTEWYTENTIKVKLETNGYDTAYGFKIDKVETRPNSGFITVPPTDVITGGNNTIPVTNTAIKIGEGRDPAIYGKNVVWSNNGIHLYDLDTSLNTQISLTGLYPAIYGNRIAWLDDNGGSFILSIYDKSTGAISYITQNVDDSSKPAIYGDKIVWSANYYDGTYSSNVYLYDISTSEQIKISDGCNPDIYGDKVAYMHYGQDSPEIHIYDITTQTDIKAISGGYPDNPHIYENNTICSDFYTRLGFIILYDIATGKETAITSDNADSGDPNNPDCGCDTGFHNEVFGNSVVYAKVTDDCLGKAGVYVYNISTAKSTMIFEDGNNTGTTPDIYDNIVIWGYDDLYNNGTGKSGRDIYVYKLSGSPTDSLASSSGDTADVDNLSASFYANVKSGTAPLKVLFTSSTTGNPSSYFWVFEPSTSSDWNSKHAVTALHTFRNPGVYTVSLTVTNDNGSATVTKNNYITVS